MRGHARLLVVDVCMLATQVDMLAVTVARFVMEVTLDTLTDVRGVVVDVEIA